jgi:hypothetical protein
MSQATLDSFMAILTTLRAVHGVPISVVLCCIQVAHSSKLSSLPTSLLSGDAGLVAREFHAPTSINLLGTCTGIIRMRNNNMYRIMYLKMALTLVEFCYHFNNMRMM